MTTIATTTQIIDLISEVKWEQTKKFILEGDFTTAWLWTFAYSSVFLVMSALLVAYQPAAAGSGIPEIIGFLNGTRIKDIFKVRRENTPGMKETESGSTHGNC